MTQTSQEYGAYEDITTRRQPYRKKAIPKGNYTEQKR